MHLSGIPDGVEIWGKCEWFNPGGSVKDRTARSLVIEGERRGALRGGRTIIDSSSGNTAVGLALVGRARGYAVELVMPESVSAERRRLCEAYGATVMLTPAFEGSDGALSEVRRRVAAEPGSLLLRRPVPQRREPARALPHHRPRDLGADRRAR